MTSFKVRKKFISFAAIAIVFVVFMSLGVCFAVGDNSANIASADATVGDRIEMIDLWERYPMRVIGPLASKNAAGQYVDSAGNPVVDKYKNPTNNIYKIPADQYFNVENYIYTESNTDDIGGGKTGRTLFGWKPNIVPANPSNEEIDEQGKIVRGTNAGKIGMYVEYVGTIFYGTLGKYALIVPDDITKVGRGNGAFVTNGFAYYATSIYVNNKRQDAVENVVAGENMFTDFGSFIFTDSQSLGLTKSTYIQPRERLAGVYFSENSKLHTIVGGTTDAESGMNALSRSTKNYDEKSAFAYCNNMRFFILPDGVKTIGRGAFYNCAQLVDANIPAAVGSGEGEGLGINAFYGCSSLLHITVPSGVKKNTGAFSGCTKLKDIENLSDSFVENDFPAEALFNYTTEAKKSALYVVGGEPTYNEDGTVKEYDTGLNGFLFCKNVRGTDVTFATISASVTKKYVKDKWYALGFAGETDTSGEKVYVLPETFNDKSDRRKGVKYDYIDAGAHKCLNSIGSTDADLVKKYDIAKDFASGTWCINIIIPKAVEIVGDNAFYGSHTRYMETYATWFGAWSFANNNDVDSNQGSAQWYYFHNEKVNGEYQEYHFNVTNVSVSGSSNQSSFVYGSGSVTRYYIFESRDLYNAVTLNGNGTLPSALKTNNCSARYQIPVYANVYSESGEQFTVTESNMKEKFFNDSDFGDVTIQKDEWNKIVFTKRLNGFDFTAQKQRAGNWTTSAN
ncbi:MAG: leucine-rich repeat domain-containing protein, partial [Clostridia bacterium]|nr:leucine-rich repeat domain-containing protein [Clostridia bacterium]